MTDFQGIAGRDIRQGQRVTIDPETGMVVPGSEPEKVVLPDGRGWEPVFVADGRRGLWFRDVLTDTGERLSLELCAGRDGDDSHARLEAGVHVTCEVITRIVDVLTDARFAFEHLVTKAKPVTSDPSDCQAPGSQVRDRDTCVYLATLRLVRNDHDITTTVVFATEPGSAELREELQRTWDGRPWEYLEHDRMVGAGTVWTYRCADRDGWDRAHVTVARMEVRR